MNATKPTTPCRCCGNELATDWQQPPLPGREGFWLLKCRVEGCALKDYTFSTRDYATKDLTDYLPCKAIG